jgi:hypothetical protein
MGFQWPFRHFIAYVKARCRLSLNPSVQHGPNIIIYCRSRRRNVDPRKKPTYEHAQASAAQRLRPNRDYAQNPPIEYQSVSDT